MTIRWKDGKVDRLALHDSIADARGWVITRNSIVLDELADALDECVRRLRAFHNAGDDAPHWVRRDSLNTLREIGVEP